MDRIEMVERLREKTGVSYEEAKAALESSEWDLLDAVVLLEKQGKVKNDTAYTTKRTTKDEESRTDNREQQPKGDGFEKFMRFVGRLIHKGNTNSLIVMRGGEKKFRLPVTAFVLLLFFAFYFTIPAMIISLFFGFHYKFVGPDLGKDSINNAMGKATKAAEAVKKEVQREMQDDTKRSKEEIKDDLKAAKDEIMEDLREVQKDIDDMMQDLKDEDE